MAQEDHHRHEGACPAHAGAAVHQHGKLALVKLSDTLGDQGHEVFEMFFGGHSLVQPLVGMELDYCLAFLELLVAHFQYPSQVEPFLCLA